MIRLLKGHTYVGKRADRQWPGRFPRRTIIGIYGDEVRYCRNERDTTFKFHETDIESFKRWADEAKTSALWGKDDEAMILKRRRA